MTQPLRAAIFDVDGVLVDSPHERAWREALADFADPAGFTPDFYQAEVAGRPRLDGARATLAAIAPPASEARVAAYAAAKQARIEALIATGAFRVFDDAARLAARLHEAGWRLALASSSRNAAAMMARLALPDGTPLASLFHADLSGVAVTRGKPDPELFLRAAAALGVPPEACLVVEDAPAGIAAARAAGMTSLAIARRQDAPLLAAAGVIVDNLDRFNPPDIGWTIAAEGVDPARESSVEARLSLANGFLGERAARVASRGPAWTSRLPWLRWAAAPRCVIAGVFDVQDTVPPIAAQSPAPDWSRLRLTLDGARLRLTDGDCLAHRRTLDLRRGVLTGEWRHRLAGTEITLRVTRALSLADRALALQRVEIRLDRDGIEVGLTALLDLAGPDLDLIALEPDALSWRTPSETAALAARARLLRAGTELPPLPAPALQWCWSWTSVAGETLVLERLTAASRADLATARAARDVAPPWRPALQSHIDAWAARWQASDIALDGDPAIARALRFALYHLNAVANPDDPAVSIGARALSGEAYLGHVFWDTEIYLLPFYIAAWPAAARALLLYRHRTLPAARAKATSIGCDGALFAWESADSGAETTPAQLLGADGMPVDILTGRQEQHISADIAYAVWQYWRATGDAAFMRAAGAELLLDIARFWFSRAPLEADGRRHIRHVIGPDEYHEDIDDNAFTNTMAAWSIARALDAVALGFAPAAPEHDAWRTAIPQFATGLDPATGLYEQFAGFHALAPIDLASLPQGVPADVALGRDRVRASQIVKQADVVMLAALLPDAFPGATLAANYDHYAPRCAHGSSLSHAMHALVAARLGRADEALAHLRATADADLAETTDSGYGVHIAGLGGLWQAVLLGFAGLDLMAETLTLAPRLPAHWTRLEFPLHWQGRRLTCRLGANPAITLLDGPALDARVSGIEIRLEPGIETKI